MAAIASFGLLGGYSMLDDSGAGTAPGTPPNALLPPPPIGQRIPLPGGGGSSAFGGVLVAVPAPESPSIE